MSTFTLTAFLFLSRKEKSNRRERRYASSQCCQCSELQILGGTALEAIAPCWSRSRGLIVHQSDYRANVSVWAGALSAAISRGSAPLVVGACRRGNTRLTAVIGGLVLALASLFTSFAVQMHQVLLRCVTAQMLQLSTAWATSHREELGSHRKT